MRNMPGVPVQKGDRGSRGREPSDEAKAWGSNYAAPAEGDAAISGHAAQGLFPATTTEPLSCQVLAAHPKALGPETAIRWYEPGVRNLSLEAAQYQTVVVTSLAAGPESRHELARLRADLDAQAEDLQRTLAELEIAIVDCYLVKLWPDARSGLWVAHCPTVRCAVQQTGRDEALAAIAESIAEMLDVLAGMGAELPVKDIPGSVA